MRTQHQGNFNTLMNSITGVVTKKLCMKITWSPSMVLLKKAQLVIKNVRSAKKFLQGNIYWPITFIEALVTFLITFNAHFMKGTLKQGLILYLYTLNSSIHKL